MGEKGFWANHSLSLDIAERIKLPISRTKSQYSLIDTSQEMEMPTHTGKSQNKQLKHLDPSAALEFFHHVLLYWKRFKV